MKAMIFAAGMGTRLKPLTNTQPKALVEIGGMSLLERCILNLIKAGVSQIIINVHHFGQQIIDFIEERDFNIPIYISDERNELLNTGGGLLKAKSLLEGQEPVLIVNADVLTNLQILQLIKYHQHKGALATLVVRRRETSRYLLFNEEQLVGWKNIKTNETKEARPNLINDAEAYAFSGIQIIEPKLLSLITEQGAFSSIDMYLRLAQTESIISFVDNDSIWMDLGKIEELKNAEIMISRMM